MTYTDTSRPGFVGDFLGRIQWQTFQLGEPEGQRLRGRVEEVLRYLVNPTFQEYYRLKTGGLHFTFSPSTNAVRAWSAHGPAEQGPIPGDPELLAHVLWDNTHTRAAKPNVPRLGAVCLDNVAAAVGRTNTGWDLLGGKVAKGQTAAFEAPEPGFVYWDRSPLAGSGVGPTNLIFQLSFYAKLAGSTNAGPVYISLAWLPSDENWALNRLIADQWVGLRTVF